MGKRPVLERYIQVDVPPLVKTRLRIAAEKWHGGNISEYVRKWLYRGLIEDDMIEPHELAAALAGLESTALLNFLTNPTHNGKS